MHLLIVFDRQPWGSMKMTRCDVARLAGATRASPRAQRVRAAGQWRPAGRETK